MNKIRLMLVIFVMFLTIGCASTADVPILQNQVNSLETKMYTVSSVAASSRESAEADKISSEQLVQKLQGCFSKKISLACRVQSNRKANDSRAVPEK